MSAWSINSKGYMWLGVYDIVTPSDHLGLGMLLPTRSRGSLLLQMAVRAVPYHKDFLVLLGSDGSAEGNAAVTVHMAHFARSLGVINKSVLPDTQTRHSTSALIHSL